MKTKECSFAILSKSTEHPNLKNGKRVPLSQYVTEIKNRYILNNLLMVI